MNHFRCVLLSFGSTLLSGMSSCQAEGEGHNLSEDQIMIYFFAGFILLIIFIGFFIVGRRKKTKEEQAAKLKIHELRASGQELHVNKTEPLTDEDIDYLNRYLRHTLIAITVILSLIALAFFVFGEGFFYVVGLGLLVLIYPARKYTKQGIDRVLEEGRKQVIRGIITDRFTTTTGSSKSRTTHYWLMLGDVKMKVTSTQYSTYAVGDAAEFHTVDYPKGTAFIIRDTKIDGAGLR